MSSTIADRFTRGASLGGPRSARRLARPAALLLALALGAVAPAAHAQADKAAAESLFQAGKSLMTEGKYDEACPKFVESQRLDPSSGTLLNLGKCYEVQGKTASAWAEYKEAATLARAAGQTERETAAKDFASKLEPKLSKLRVDATAPVAGLVIKKDGVDMGRATLGIAIAVDPGEHTIEASAPGYNPWTTKITVGKESDSKTVTIPALEKAPEGAGVVTPPPGGGTPPGGEPGGPPPGGDTSGSGDTMKTAGFVVGGVGVVGGALGAVFGLMASSQASGAEDDPALCPNKQCTPAGREEIDGASGKALVSTIGFAVGGAGLVAGAILILTAGPSKKEARALPAGGFASVRVVPTGGAAGGGLSMVGRF